MKKKLEQYSINDHGISLKDIDSDVFSISDSLISNGYQAFVVGGCIRDMLLGKKPKDFDIATDASPQEIRKLFSRAKIIGRRFKIVHVYISEEKYFEVTTFRSDVKKRINDKKFRTNKGMIKRDNFYGSISQDAFRRDFTINSLYLDLDSGILHDYVNGLEDIKAKKLRLINKPVSNKLSNVPISNHEKPLPNVMSSTLFFFINILFTSVISNSPLFDGFNLS